MLRAFKRKVMAAIPPVIFLTITGYFAWNAVHGARGLEAQALQRAELAKANADLDVVDAQRRVWEAKVAALSGPAIAPDMLDEQARKMLNDADPSDLVVDLPAPAAK